MAPATRAQTKPLTPRAVSRTPTPKSPLSDPQPTSSSRRKKSAELAETKARRVRTGCLTCRERHLKCDEALGRCLNCRKSDRICRRGVRLNFIDIQTVTPPHIIARPRDAKVTFRDDSRFIASEYVGGFERYPPLQPESPVADKHHAQHDSFEAIGPGDLSSLFHSMAHSFDPSGFDVPHSTAADLLIGTDQWTPSHLHPGDELLPHGSSNFARKLAMRQENPSFLSDPEQVFLLRVFVEQVGVWMDSMDETKHFTHIIPAHAIDEPMLLRALLACGAQHLYLVDSTFGEDKASHFYDLASQDLMNALQDPNRDSVLCATAALVLGVYETMSYHSRHSVNHLAGSRALTRECGWSARTPGLGGACFWISVGMELLSCLHHDWAFSWDPDTWGVNMDMDHATPSQPRAEDVWSHRILYICAKITNFRITLRHSPRLTDQAAQTTRLNEQFQEWSLYNSWCDQWAKTVPRSMMPLGYLQPWQTNSKSVFPQIWLPKSSVIVARLFYHTARILLAQSHPLRSEFEAEMHSMQRNHSYDICGLVAHVKDRSVTNIAIRCLAIAATCLDSHEAQEEVLGIFDSVVRDTGWRVDPIKETLQQNWGWPVSHFHTVAPADVHNHFYGLDQSLSIPEHTEMASCIVNPLLASADFSLENHPYQGYYVAPHHALEHYHFDAYLI